MHLISYIMYKSCMYHISTFLRMPKREADEQCGLQRDEYLSVSCMENGHDDYQ